ncbi:hypothetical protein D3C87_35350 [compost metagenome]
MKPKSIYGVLTYTAIFGSMIYAPLLWDPLFSGARVEWDEVPACFIFTLIVAFVCLAPFYLLLKVFQIIKWKAIPYDGWQLQAFACLVYSFFFFSYNWQFSTLMNWYLGYYPVGIAFFIWYSNSKSKHTPVEAPGDEILY